MSKDQIIILAVIAVALVPLLTFAIWIVVCLLRIRHHTRKAGRYFIQAQRLDRALIYSKGALNELGQAHWAKAEAVRDHMLRVERIFTGRRA